MENETPTPKIYYTALFVIDSKKLVEDFPPKHARVFAHHSTIAFEPESVEGIEVGKQHKIKVIGRAYDEKGDVLLVENPKSKNKFPHITLSCREGVDPVYSNELLEIAHESNTIEYVDPYSVDMIEGYETMDLKIFPESLPIFNPH
jgi:hypothetical protein